jgi:UDPglucose--hexose-1-phosphate uridylyltransferase
MFVDDEITGQLRIVAPNRAKRLGPRPEGCPFCLGNEEHTPPEVDRLHGETSGDPWLARTVPNLFPLSDVHEVIIPTSRHALSLRELDDTEWLSLARMWQQRLAAHADTDDSRYSHLFVNDGKAAGASLPHTHAQLVSVPRVAQVEQLTEHVRDPASCAACAAVKRGGALVVAEPDGFVLYAHPSPRTGGGLMLVAREHATDATSIDSAQLAQALQVAVQALPEGDFNCWLVHDPKRAAHVYTEFVPRTAIPAGVEMALGAGVSILDPEAVAEASRERLKTSVLAG